MSDIEKSFAFLQDNIPQWLQDIARVEEKVTAMQDDIANVPVSQSPFAKGKTGSTDSIRPEKLDAIAEDATPSGDALANPPGSRKRKTPSISSGRVSGPMRYRPKTMVIVSYDGDMQKSLELLVRALGSGRNMLRKAKMEAKMKELAALAGSSDDEEDADDNDTEDLTSKMGYRPRLTSMRLRAAARRGGAPGLRSNGATPTVELFETTDKTLEQAQELCEKSAHLSLREGDCRTELTTVRKHLEDVLVTAKTEVVKAVASKSQSPQLEAPDTPGTSVSSTEPSYKRHFPSLSASAPAPESTPKTLAPQPPMAAAIDPKTMEIEVDDDDEDEEPDYVMPPVRFTSRRAVRA